MILFLLYFAQFILLFILLIILAVLILWMYGGIVAKVPFVPVPSSVLDDIKKALNVNDDSVVYDLGCGNGKILFYLSRFHPRAKYIGIENSLFPILLSNIRNWWHVRHYGFDNVQIQNLDFFKRDLSDATHIFTYLYPNIMDDLLPKLNSELKSGTKLVSASFKFTNKKPVAEIDLKRGKHQLAKKLYVYEF